MLSYLSKTQKGAFDSKLGSLKTKKAGFYAKPAFDFT
jgi:hypothetical protein